MAGASSGFAIMAVALLESLILEIVIREIKSSTAGGNMRTTSCAP
jgi:hypothetical protein